MITPWVPIDLLADDADLEADEGFRGLPYKDTRGVWTNGFGNTLNVRPDTPAITRERALAQLNANFASSNARLAQALPWIATLDPVRQDVLGEMAFNLGVAGVRGFKHFLADVEAGNYGLAAAQMLMSDWAEQVGGRAMRLSILMERGIRT